MPVVPFDRQRQNGNLGGIPQQRPSETDYLLALAEMHRQGRFETAMDVSKFKPSKNIEDRRGQEPPEEPPLEYKMELKDITTPRSKDKG